MFFGILFVLVNVVFGSSGQFYLKYDLPKFGNTGNTIDPLELPFIVYSTDNGVVSAHSPENWTYFPTSYSVINLLAGQIELVVSLGVEVPDYLFEVSNKLYSQESNKILFSESLRSPLIFTRFIYDRFVQCLAVAQRDMMRRLSNLKEVSMTTSMNTSLESCGAMVFFVTLMNDLKWTITVVMASSNSKCGTIKQLRIIIDRIIQDVFERLKDPWNMSADKGMVQICHRIDQGTWRADIRITKNDFILLTKKGAILNNPWEPMCIPEINWASSLSYRS